MFWKWFLLSDLNSNKKKLDLTKYQSRSTVTHHIYKASITSARDLNTHPELNILTYIL